MKTEKEIKEIEELHDMLNDLFDKMNEGWEELESKIRSVHGLEICDCGLGQNYCDKSCE